MKDPQVTIVVVPRERFGLAARSLRSIYEQSDIPFRLVYVDGGSPSGVRRYLERQAEERGFELIRTDHYLSPNQARNLGLRRVKSEYVVFIDNDVVVAPGWLAPLVQISVSRSWADRGKSAALPPSRTPPSPPSKRWHPTTRRCETRHPFHQREDCDRAIPGTLRSTNTDSPADIPAPI